MRLGFLASGNGSSLRAIVAACEAGTLNAEPAIVVSNKRDAAALDFAREHGIVSRVIPTAKDPDAADVALEAALSGAAVSHVVLSGYLRKLGPRVLNRFSGRVLNVHPALLPRHGGAGLYGQRVHQSVLASGDRVSGATVHLVDEIYDHGEVVAQTEVPVVPGDTAQTLQARVMAAEPGLFIQTLSAIESGRLKLPSLAR